MTEPPPSPRPRGRPRKPVATGTGNRSLRIQRRNLTERACERLRDLIVHGELSEGAELVEAELTALIGISRTPLREALKLLAAAGLVELRPNRSARVALLDRDEILHLFETLSGLERHAAELAARRIDETGLARLSQMQAEMEAHFEARVVDPYFTVNHAAHQAIVTAAANPVLAETHRALMLRAERVRFAALGSRRRWSQSVAEHREILAALSARDAQRAGALLAQHVMETGHEVALALAMREHSAGNSAA